MGHYCLDSLCHPYIHQHTDDGPIGHVQLETEFDRYLMALDGKLPPHTQDFSRHMKLRTGQCVTVAGFFPPCTPRHIHQCTSNMARHTHLLATVNHTLVKNVLRLAGEEIAQQQMPTEPDMCCENLDAPLMELYDKALDRYPGMILELLDHLNKNAPLGENFAADFG